jgi:hypothetical protein
MKTITFHHLVVRGNSRERAPVAINICTASVTLLFSSVTSSFFPGFSFPTPIITSIFFFHQELNSFAHVLMHCSTALTTAGKSLSNDETVIHNQKHVLNN